MVSNLAFENFINFSSQKLKLRFRVSICYLVIICVVQILREISFFQIWEFQKLPFWQFWTLLISIFVKLYNFSSLKLSKILTFLLMMLQNLDFLTLFYHINVQNSDFVPIENLFFEFQSLKEMKYPMFKMLSLQIQTKWIFLPVTKSAVCLHFISSRFVLPYW